MIYWLRDSSAHVRSYGTLFVGVCRRNWPARIVSELCHIPCGVREPDLAYAARSYSCNSRQAGRDVSPRSDDRSFRLWLAADHSVVSDPGSGEGDSCCRPSRSRIRNRTGGSRSTRVHATCRLLRHPRIVGMRRAAGQMHAAAADFNEEQHIQSLQPHRVDGEEIHRDDAFGLRTQKVSP